MAIWTGVVVAVAVTDLTLGDALEVESSLQMGQLLRWCERIKQ